MKNNGKKTLVYAIIVIAALLVIQSALNNVSKKISAETIRIISSTDNQNVENVITKYAEDKGIKVSIDYAGTLEIMEKLNSGEQYDAVWASN